MLIFSTGGHFLAQRLYEIALHLKNYTISKFENSVNDWYFVLFSSQLGNIDVRQLPFHSYLHITKVNLSVNNPASNRR